jgi:autotransporter-associated beta strand protein
MKQNLLHAVALFAATSFALSATAATNYWDNNGDTAGFGTAGGTWGVDANWTADAAGEAAPDGIDTTADDDLFFGTAVSGLEAGSITVGGTGQAFRTLTFGAASGALALSGGTLNLAAPASKVSVNCVTATIGSTLAGTNGLEVFSAPQTYTNFLTETAAIVFTNATLADYSKVGGIMHGAWVAKLPANAYHFANDGATATWQFQALDDSYTKCVKVELKQAGPDIAGRAVYAKNVSGSQLGYDFDTGGTLGTVAASSTANGYGVAQLTLLPLTRAYEPFLTTSPTVVLTNTSLADLTGVEAGMAGTSISPGPLGPVPTAAYYFSNNGATGTVQMQAFNGGYTKCVKIELTQSGANVAARALYAKYHNSGANVLGFDFDAGGTASGVATSFITGNYGLCQLRFPGDRRLTLTGTNTYAGATVINSGVLEIGGAGLLGGGSYSGAVANVGQLLYSSSADQTLAGNISGAGLLVKRAASKVHIPMTYASFLPATPTTSVILPRTPLSDCIAAAGNLGGTSISGGSTPGTPFFFTNDGTNATWQLQTIADAPWTKCVKIRLTQSGRDIVATVLYARYVNNGSVLGYDFDTQPANNNTIATSSGSGGYGAAVTVVTVNRYPKLSLSGSNSYTGGTLVESGTLEASALTSLPTTGGVIVNSEAELLLNVPGDPGIYASVGGNNPITVRGGLLTINGKFNAGHARPITVDGGVINSTVTTGDDNSNYMNKLTLMNGASITGYKIRVGFVSVPTITVAGTNTCSIPAGLNMVKYGENPLTFNVADVTGDEAADLTIPGVIRDYTGAQYEYMPILKTGAGTLSLSGVNTHKGVYTLTQGGLALDGNGALNAANDIVLNGGSLAMGAVTNTAGMLTMSADSTLALGEGTLAFAASTGAVWTAGADLTLAGALGRYTLRFGTDETALTADQLKAITYNGSPVRLRPDGYVAEPATGTIILMQ